MGNTVTIKRRIPDDLNRYALQKSWVFVDDLIAGLHMETGIAWDGKYVWLCTTSAFGGRPSKLLAFDPVQGVQAVPKLDITGIGSFDSALDIVWNQLYGDRWALYLLTDSTIDPPTFKIHHVNRTGAAVTLATLPLDVERLAYRSICFDGLYIYVTVDFFTSGLFQQRLERFDIVNMVGTHVSQLGIPATTNHVGTGIVFDGFRFHYHHDLFGFFNFWGSYIRGAFSSSLSQVIVGLGEPLVGDFVGPCTYDRKFIYNFEVV